MWTGLKEFQIEMTELVTSSSPEAQQEANEETALLGGDAVANQNTVGRVQKFKGLIASYKFRLLVMAVGKLVYLPLSQIGNIAVLAAKHYYDGLPALDPFVVAGLRPVAWPHRETFVITGGSLDGALVFYGDLAEPAQQAQQS